MCLATDLGSSGKARVTVAPARGGVLAIAAAALAGVAKWRRSWSARWRRGVSGRASPWPYRSVTRAGGFCWFPVQLLIPPDAGAAALALRQRLVPAPVNSNVSSRKMPSTLNNLFWHDGNLASIAFSIDKKGKSAVTLSVLLYTDENAPERQPFQVECQSVSRFNCTLDTSELKDNMSAGNISNAYLKDATLWLYFTDGVLEVHAKKFRLSKS